MHFDQTIKVITMYADDSKMTKQIKYRSYALSMLIYLGVQNCFTNAFYLPNLLVCILKFKVKDRQTLNNKHNYTSNI